MNNFASTCVMQMNITDNEFENINTPITEKIDAYEKGIPLIDGGVWYESFMASFDPRIYTWKDPNEKASNGSNRYTSFLIKADPVGLDRADAITAAVYNSDMQQIWYSKLGRGIWQIALPWGYTIRVYTQSENVVKMYTGLRSNPIAADTSGGINPWAGKCIAFYGDSVTYIGQGTGTSYGHASSPYVSDWGTNWQLYIAKYLGLKEFYSRGVGSAMYEYQSWVQYAHTETGYSGDRPYPFVDFDAAEEKAEFTKTHGYLAAWDRIKAQFPASIKDTIDAIFITDSNSAVGHTSESWDVPVFIVGATKDADWAADTTYNVNGGDYDITTYAGAICSMIMKLQAWMPNVQIIIGSQISGRGDENISGPAQGENFTKLDEAWRGMICAEKTRKICAMMSIPYIPVFESMAVNPLNRNGKISDIVHPFTKAGGYRVGKTIAQYLTLFTPSTPAV